MDIPTNVQLVLAFLVFGFDRRALNPKPASMPENQDLIGIGKSSCHLYLNPEGFRPASREFLPVRSHDEPKLRKRDKLKGMFVRMFST